MANKLELPVNPQDIKRNSIVTLLDEVEKIQENFHSDSIFDNEKRKAIKEIFKKILSLSKRHILNDKETLFLRNDEKKPIYTAEFSKSIIDPNKYSPEQVLNEYFNLLNNGGQQNYVDIDFYVHAYVATRNCIPQKELILSDAEIVNTLDTYGNGITVVKHRIVNFLEFIDGYLKGQESQVIAQLLVDTHRPFLSSSGLPFISRTRLNKMPDPDIFLIGFDLPPPELI